MIKYKSVLHNIIHIIYNKLTDNTCRRNDTINNHQAFISNDHKLPNSKVKVYNDKCQ